MNSRDYRSDPSFNQSFLKKFLTSPSHAKSSIGKPPTDAMEFGSALHDYILEPDKFYSRYMPMDKLDGRTPEGKAQKAEKERLEAQGVKILTGADMAILNGMWDAIEKSPLAAGYIWGGEGYNEHPLYWTCHYTGAPCKARLDRVVPGRYIVDLKTIGKEASISALWYQIRDLHYDFQGAFYQEAWRMTNGEVLPFIMVFVETKPPHGVRVVRLEQEMVNTAFTQCLDTLKEALYCQQSGHWPAYPQEVLTIGERRPSNE